MRSLFSRTLAAAAIVAACAAPGAAAATYPDADGSSFDTGAEGWTSTVAECTLPGGTPLCSQQNSHDPAAGRQLGGLVARTTVVVNALQLLQGTSVWRSPSFTAQASEGAGTFSYERSFSDAGLADLAPRAAIEAVLVDEASGVGVTLDSEEIAAVNGGFAAREAAVPAGTLAAGRSYRIELRSVTATTAVGIGVLGSAAIHYDNVALRTAGPAGSSGTPGVQFTAQPIDVRALVSLVGDISLRAEAGNGPGGTLVPLDRCTIVGTPGHDRIQGSSGNDVICGLGGNDVIAGAGGRDLVDGGDGNDRLSGAGGADVLLGLRGGDRISGGAGGDGGGGGAGADRLRGNGAGDRLFGASGGDRVGGDAGADRLNGGRGADRLKGGGGSDRIAGGPGRDRVAARDRRRDRVSGGSGRDRAVVDTQRRGLRLPDLVGGVERGGA